VMSGLIFMVSRMCNHGRYGENARGAGGSKSGDLSPEVPRVSSDGGLVAIGDGKFIDVEDATVYTSDNGVPIRATHSDGKVVQLGNTGGPASDEGLGEEHLSQYGRFRDDPIAVVFYGVMGIIGRSLPGRAMRSVGRGIGRLVGYKGQRRS
jgi:hypothetical protein